MYICRDPEIISSVGAVYGLVSKFADERNNIMDQPLISMLKIARSSAYYAAGTFCVSCLLPEKVGFMIPLVLGLATVKYV